MPSLTATGTGPSWTLSRRCARGLVPILSLRACRVWPVPSRYKDWSDYTAEGVHTQFHFRLLPNRPRHAPQAGLEVESVSRWHFGTTYLIVARPGRAALALPG